MRLLLLLFFCSPLLGAPIDEKVLICGVCRNIEKSIPNTIESIEALGAQFDDYRIIIYENNSKDRTKKLLKGWAKREPRLTLISEQVSKKRLTQESQMKLKIPRRTEKIARARNIVLKEALQPKYDGYSYLIWADLDFLNPWDIEHIVETILHPEEEWDAVFANGAYDIYAFRDEEFPMGEELLGANYYWAHRPNLQIDREGPWRPVYSAFGGIGIYQREALRGCSYSGVVTRELEEQVATWIDRAQAKGGVWMVDCYLDLLKSRPIIDLKAPYLADRQNYPAEFGMRLFNSLGEGRVVWFSAREECTLPEICEHVPFHASMIKKGRGRLFINPKIVSITPEDS